MLTIEELINQVSEVLIETNDSLSRPQMYSRFVNECNELKLNEEDFYKKILKPAHININWETIEEKKKQQEEIERKRIEDQEKRDKEIKNAPEHIGILIKKTFENGTIKASSLQNIFNKAEAWEQDSNKVALDIDEKLGANNFKAHPPANLEANTLKEILLSTDWYSPADFPQQVKVVKPVKPDQSKMIGLIILCVLILVIIIYLIPKGGGDSEVETPVNPPVPDTAVAVKPPPTDTIFIDTSKKVDTPPVIVTNTELTTEEKEDISKLLNSFYTAENNEEIGTMLDYFEFPIQRYYNSFGIDADSLGAMFRTSFNKKLLKHSITINPDETIITKTVTGYVILVIAVYKKVLQKEPDTEKFMDLRINIKMNAAKKITTIYAG